jgi:single-stranded-DNA-specific exonuclease
LDCLHDPFLLDDMEQAVSRLREAIARREKILIFGDYDVDGISGTALLVRELSRLGSSPYYYIPNRLIEGYGLNKERIAKAQQEGITLILTVDNGISSHEEVRYAASLGIDVIVCDHHEPDGQLPLAVSVLNPKRENSKYPFRELSGVGVALKLMTALSGKLPENLDFTALGTIADIVPLVDENRILARAGLAMINTQEEKSPGLWELSRVSGLEGKQINAGNVAFQLAPRLNAAGRLGSGQLGVQLLLTASSALAQRIARKLDEENRNRQTIESEILAQALEKVEQEFKAERDFSIVLSDNRWHPGVIGIVASKLVELYHRPAILIAMGEQVGKGSARSIRSLHICDALRQCEQHLVGFGGHRYAAGLTVEAAKFCMYRDAFEQVCKTQLLGKDLRPAVRADAVVALEEVTGPVIEQLERLAPFGNANPTPAFACMGVTVAGGVQLLRGKHLKFAVRQGKKTLPVIGFKMDQYEQMVKDSPLLDIIFTPQFNTYKGSTTIQLTLRDARPHPGSGQDIRH